MLQLDVFFYLYYFAFYTKMVNVIIYKLYFEFCPLNWKQKNTHFGFQTKHQKYDSKVIILDHILIL